MTWCRQFLGVTSSGILGWLLVALPAAAQIVGDGTLGTQVNGSLTAPCTGVCFITNGATRGSNLFHSFQQFSLPNSTDIAGFLTTPTIQNVIVRVTGVGQPFISNINGTIATINAAGTAINPANFFLLNPNGIVFGPGATLLNGGAFLATTASGMQFQDGTVFRTTDVAAPLLTISVPIGLQFGQTPGTIQVQGSRLSAGNTDSFSDFALVGGNVSLDNTRVTTPGQQVTLGGLAASGAVGLTVAGNTLRFEFPDRVPLANVQVTNNSNVRVRGNGGGSIAVNSGSLTVADSQLLAGIEAEQGSATTQAGDILLNATNQIRVETSLINNDVGGNALGQGGNVIVKTPQLNVLAGGQISASTLGNGNSGTLQVQAGVIELVGTDPTNGAPSGLFTTVGNDASGKGGNLIVTTGQLNVQDGASVSASTSGIGDAGTLRITADAITVAGFGPDDSNSRIVAQANSGSTGNAGGLTIDTQQLTALNGGQISVSTSSSGRGGDLQVRAGAINLVGNAPDNSPSGLFANVNGGASGRGGNLIVTTGSLMVQDGASVSASTFGIGNAGALRITADAITVTGFSPAGSGSDISALANPGSAGNAGGLTLDTRQLFALNGGQIAVSTFGSGNGGDLQIHATDINLVGTAANGIPSGLFADVNEDASGKGGNLLVTTGQLSVQDGATISASTFGIGDAGAVRITADAITVTGFSPAGSASNIRAQAEPGSMGNAGGLTLDTRQLFALNGGQIAVSNFGGGNGGDLQIHATDINLVGTAANSNPSGLFANVGNNANRGASGKGGNLIVTTGQLNVQDGATISTSTFGIGNAGALRITADAITVTGFSPVGSSSKIVAQAEPGSMGNAGGLTLDTQQLNALNGGQIAVSTFGSGAGGDLQVKATVISLVGTSADGDPSGLFANVNEDASGKGGNLLVTTGQLSVQDGANVSASTFGIGDAGALRITADGIAVTGFSPAGSSSKIVVQAEPGSTGNAGGLTLDTQQLFALNGGQISVSTFSGGNAGDLTIHAKTIDLSGVNGTDSNLPSGLFAQVDTGGRGQGGNLLIDTDRLILRAGALVSVQTLDRGNAGSLTITAPNSIQVIGVAPDGSHPSRLTVSTTGQGNAGDLKLTTGQLVVRDGAAITVGSGGGGSSGSLDATAKSIVLDRQGKLIADTTSGNGGNITLTVQDYILLRHQSQISTTAGTDRLGGNGGNITINAPNGFLVTAPNENNDITANAFLGSGGRVTISAQGIYWFTPRSRAALVQLLGTNDPAQLNPSRLPTNDITAISQGSPTLSGTVTLTTPDVDPSRGLVELPAIVDASNQIAQGCGAENRDSVDRFTVTGRGGVPANPEQPLSSEAVWQDTRLTSAAGVPTGTGEQRQPQTVDRHPATPIVPAVGWVFNGNGEVTLVAAAQAADPLRSLPSNCRVR